MPSQLTHRQQRRRDIIDFWNNRLDSWGRRRYLIWVGAKRSYKTRRWYRLPKTVRRRLGKLMNARRREGGTYIPRLMHESGSNYEDIIQGIVGKYNMQQVTAQIADIIIKPDLDKTHILSKTDNQYVESFMVGDQVITPLGKGTIVNASYPFAEISIDGNIKNCDLSQCIKVQDSIIYANKISCWDLLDKQSRTDIISKMHLDISLDANWDDITPQMQDAIIQKYNTVETKNTSVVDIIDNLGGIVTIDKLLEIAKTVDADYFRWKSIMEDKINTAISEGVIGYDPASNTLFKIEATTDTEGYHNTIYSKFKKKKPIQSQ